MSPEHEGTVKAGDEGAAAVHGVVDRVEDEVAMILLEEGGRIYLPASRLPAGAGAGTVLRVRFEVEGDGDAGDVRALIASLERGEHLE